MNNKRLSINMIANLVAFALNMLVSFFLSPYIVENLGSEAYGFISMITNLLSTSQIVTLAFNSMGARFITIAIHRGDEKKAKQYFSSLFFANLLMASVIFIVFCVMTWNMDVVFDVPAHLKTDVSYAFLISAFAFSLALVFSIYSVSTYAKNRLDLSAMRDMTKQMVRALSILILFLLFEPSVALVSVASLIMEVYFIFTNRKLMKKLLPDYKVQRSNFSFQALKELLTSGIWNSVGRLSYVLMSDLDLMIANIFVSAASMGVLSISKTIPSAINSLITTIVAIFIPTFTIHYAKNNIKGLLHDMNKAIKIIGVCISPVLSVFLVFGKDFYSLWQPTQDAEFLHILSVLAILPIYFTLGMKSVNNTFSVTNKLFLPTIVTFVTSVCTIITEFILLKFTSLGVLAIAATSSMYMILKDLFFIPLYAAKCLKIKWYTFYPHVISEFLIIVASIAIAYGFHSLLTIDSWLSLIAFGAIACIGLIIFNCLLVMRKEDYAKVIAKFKK